MNRTSAKKSIDSFAFGQSLSFAVRIIDGLPAGVGCGRYTIQQGRQKAKPLVSLTTNSTPSTEISTIIPAVMSFVPTNFVDRMSRRELSSHLFAPDSDRLPAQTQLHHILFSLATNPTKCSWQTHTHTLTLSQVHSFTTIVDTV